MPCSLRDQQGIFNRLNYSLTVMTQSSGSHAISQSILNRFPRNFSQDISKSCPNTSKKLANLFSIFQKLAHLTCNKIPELA